MVTKMNGINGTQSAIEIPKSTRVGVGVDAAKSNIF